jgi:acyl-CoA thioester hydrolase
VASSFVHRLRVRYSECDPQGVVFNANYVTYFDIALTELWREAIGPYTAMTDAGTDMVVAEVRARYLAAARFDDLLDLAVIPTRLGETAMTTRTEVRCEGGLVVEGEIRHVFVDMATRQKRPIPDDVRRGLEPYLREPEPALEGTVSAGGRATGVAAR